MSVVEAPAPAPAAEGSASAPPPSKGKGRLAATFYPEDDNSLQIRSFPTPTRCRRPPPHSHTPNTLLPPSNTDKLSFFFSFSFAHSFDLSAHLSDSERRRGVMEMRLVFPSSTDFYGRVTLYQLRVLGREAGAHEGR